MLASLFGTILLSIDGSKVVQRSRQIWQVSIWVVLRQLLAQFPRTFEVHAGFVQSLLCGIKILQVMRRHLRVGFHERGSHSVMRKWIFRDRQGLRPHVVIAFPVRNLAGGCEGQRRQNTECWYQKPNWSDFSRLCNVGQTESYHYEDSDQRNVG